MINKRFVIENENGLTENEIIDFFYNNENTIKSSECCWVYKVNLVEIQLSLKDGTELTFMYNDRLDFIDLSLNDFIGLGCNLVSPYWNIVKMQIDFR